MMMFYWNSLIKIMLVVKLLFSFLILSKSENSALLIRSNDVYEGLIKSIYDYNNCRSITLIYASSSNLTPSLGLEMKTKLMMLNLFLSRKLHIQTTMIDIRKFPLQISKNIDEMTNPLFIILNDSDDIKSQLASTIFTPSVRLSRGTWLIFFEDVTTVEEFCNNFFIPFDYEVLIAMRNVDEPKSESITEVYQLGNKLKYQLYGSWSIDTGLIPPTSSFLHRRSHLEGLPLRVVMSLSSAFEPRNSIFVGNLIFLDKMQLLSKIMNFTLITKYGPSIGSCNSNNNCTGIISDLVKKNIDICLSPMILTNKRLKYIDMTMNFRTVELFLYVKKPDEKSGWKEYLKPLGNDVWITICIMILLSSVILFFMEMIYNTDDGLRSWARLKIKTPNFLNCMFKVFGIICGKEIGESRSTPMRTIQVTMQITSVLIMTAYSAKLIQSLTTGIIVTPPYASVEDFLNDKTSKLSICSWSAHIKDLSGSAIKLEQQVMEKILKEKTLPATEVEGLTHLCHSYKRGFLSYNGILDRYNLPDDCEILSIGSVMSRSYSIGLQKDSPLREIINFQFLRMNEYGFTRRIADKLKRKVMFKPKELTIEWIPVRFSHVYPVNVFLTVMIILSLILLYGEIMVDDRIKKTIRTIKKATRRLRKST